MTTLHGWIQSGNYSLLRHADLPEQRGPVGVVIVPPFGWEDVSSYRPLRFLARSIAANGVPVLRYDLPGTGDSSGSLADGGLVEAWIQSVSDAAAELRTLSGVERVALFGVRLGATLAAVAASRGANVQDLLLWGVSPSGRVELREMRAYARMERWEFSIESPDGSPAEPGFEVGGFLIAPEIQRDWESLDVTALTMAPRRVLILSRDDLMPDPKVVRAFESTGCSVTVETGPGYLAMMGQPHEAVPPAATAQTVVRFLAVPRVVKTGRPPAGSAEVTIGNGDARLVERIHLIGSRTESGFGILAEPVAGVPRSECCLLFLNAGGVRHTGPNRMWVEIARRYAPRGIVSLRLDLIGIGESDGEPYLDVPNLHRECLVDQVERAMESLRSRCGFRRFAVVGLCSGAYWAFHAAMRGPDIREAVLLNPRMFFWDPEVEGRRAVRRGLKGLLSPADWWRIIRGGVPLDYIKRVARRTLGSSQADLSEALSHPQIPARRMAEAWRNISRHGTRVTLVFTEREPLLLEMEKEGQIPDQETSRIRLIRLGKAGHTFRPRWAQKIVHDIVDAEIGSVLNEERVTIATR